MTSKPWSWRVAELDRNQELGLRYEPGNWGDILKGTWAWLCATTLPEGPVRVLDPWAGAPTYPLPSLATLQRVTSLPKTNPLPEAQASYLEKMRWASTGRLVWDALRNRAHLVTFCAFDRDESRLQAWRGTGASVQAADDGAAVLAAAPRVTGATFVLIDPYDLVAEADVILPTVPRLGKDATVLFYAYNRSPQSRSRHDAYVHMRTILHSTLAFGRDLLIGRLPCDPVLPRAYHEVLLLGTADLLGRLRPYLEAQTQALAARLAADGAFEAVRGQTPASRP